MSQLRPALFCAIGVIHSLTLDKATVNARQPYKNNRVNCFGSSSSMPFDLIVSAVPAC